MGLCRDAVGDFEFLLRQAVREPLQRKGHTERRAHVLRRGITGNNNNNSDNLEVKQSFQGSPKQTSALPDGHLRSDVQLLVSRRHRSTHLQVDLLVLEAAQQRLHTDRMNAGVYIV